MDDNLELGHICKLGQVISNKKYQFSFIHTADHVTYLSDYKKWIKILPTLRVNYFFDTVSKSGHLKMSGSGYQPEFQLYDEWFHTQRFSIDPVIIDSPCYLQLTEPGVDSYQRQTSSQDTGDTKQK